MSIVFDWKLGGSDLVRREGGHTFPNLPSPYAPCMEYLPTRIAEIYGE